MRKPPGQWLPLLVLSLFSFYAANALASAQDRPSLPLPLVVQGLGHATQPVDGIWQFHLGDNPAWASPAFDDSNWQPIRAGLPWEAQGHYGYTGFAWYRRHLDLVPGESRNWKLALFLTGVDSACDIYWNGQLVGSIGKVPPHPVWYIAAGDNPELPDVQEARVFPLGSPQSGVLAIRVWRAPIVLFSFPEEGGLVAVPQVGTVQGIEALQTAAHYPWLKENLFTFAVVLLSCIIGLVSLLMWLRNRDRTLLLWLAIVMADPLEKLCIAGIPGLMSFRLGYGLIGPAIGVYDAALWFLLLALLGLNDRPRLVRWTTILAIAEVAFDLLDGSLQLFDWSHGHAHLFLLADIVLTIPPVLLEFWGVVLVVFAFRKHLNAPRWILAIAALLANLYQAMNDVTGLGIRWTHWTIGARLHTPLFTLAGSPASAHTISSTFLLVAILYAAWRHFVEQNRLQSAMQQEYHSAQELQRILIPDSLPSLSGCVVTSAYRPAQEVGGDFFQVIPLPGNAALLVIGDVSGKGLHAAMAVALLVGAIRSTVETTDDPAAILSALNRRLYGRLHGGFATCLAARLDADGACRIANAGHLPPFLNGEEVQLPPALPLGLMPNAEYDPVELRIGPDDRLTFYTDGVLEARNAVGELFGFARIAQLLAVPRDAQQIAETAQQFGQEDDITVLTFTMSPVQALVT